jgi:hypothetical protein
MRKDDAQFVSPKGRAVGPASMRAIKRAAPSSSEVAAKEEDEEAEEAVMGLGVGAEDAAEETGSAIVPRTKEGRTNAEEREEAGTVQGTCNNRKTKWSAQDEFDLPGSHHKANHEECRPPSSITPN